MDKAIFPDGVVVTTTALQTESKAKTFNIQRRHVDTTRSGRVSGLEVALDTPASRFTVSAGYAYTPRGDFVDSAGTSGLALADYTDGVANYVILVYREESGSPEAHEDGGSTRDTVISRSSEIVVMTSTEYDALSAEYDADLETNLEGVDVSTNAQDRMVVLAVIYGKGYTSGSPTVFVNGDFENGTINQQAAYPVLLTASQAASPDALITGVNLRGVDAGMTLGTTGSLEYSESGATRRLAFKEPGAGSYGSTVNITASGTYDLPRSGGGRNLTVQVVIEAFPSVGTGTLENDVTISNLYDDLGALFSVKDDLHRSKQGSNIPTSVNSHGFSPEDFPNQVLAFPQLFEVGSDFLGTAAVASIARLLVPAHASERTCILDSGASTTTRRVRLYRVPTSSYLELTFNAKWTGTEWTADETTEMSTKYVLGPTPAVGANVNGLTAYNYSGASPFDDADWTDTVLAVGGSLDVGTILPTSLDSSEIARITTTDFSTIAQRVKLLSNDSANPSGSTPLEMYLATNGTNGGAAIEIVVNAVYTPTNSTTGTWGGQNAAVASVKLDILPTGLQVLRRAAGGGSWSDQITGGAWVRLLHVDGSTTTVSAPEMSIEAGHQVAAGADLLAYGASEQLTARFKATANAGGAPSAAQNRWLMQEQLFNGSTGCRRYVYYDTTDNAYISEEAINCTWDGTAWSCDDATRGATLFRFTAGGVSTAGGYVQLFHSATGATWNDTIGGGGWTRVQATLQGGASSGVYDTTFGFLGATASGSVTNPAKETGYANTIMALNTPKAWGQVAGGTLIDGFNVASYTEPFGTNSTAGRITFGTPMADTGYVVIFSGMPGVGDFAGNSNLNDALKWHSATVKHTDYFNVTQLRFVLNDNDITTDNPNNIDFDFVVFGRQDS